MDKIANTAGRVQVGKYGHDSLIHSTPNDLNVSN